MPETSYAKYVAISVIIIAIFAVVYYNLRQEKLAPAEEIHSPYKIAFSMKVGDNEDLYLVDTEGNLERITTSPGREFLPSWSPDRSKMAFVSTTQDPNGEIYVLDMSSRNGRRITNNSAVDTTPVWSKDGTKIAFLSSRWSANATRGFYNSSLELYTMNTDGTSVSRRTGTLGNVYEDLPVQWLPDNKLLFAYKSIDNPFTVSTLDISGTLQRVSLPNGTGYPVYSPDRSKAAFVFSKGLGNIDLYVMNPDGSNLLRLTDNAEAERNPDWSPDGSAIVFVKDSSVGIEKNYTAANIRDLYIIGADGCCMKKLASGSISAFHMPAWSR